VTTGTLPHLVSVTPEIYSSILRDGGHVADGHRDKDGKKEGQGGHVR